MDSWNTCRMEKAVKWKQLVEMSIQFRLASRYLKITHCSKILQERCSKSMRMEKLTESWSYMTNFDVSKRNQLKRIHILWNQLTLLVCLPSLASNLSWLWSGASSNGRRGWSSGENRQQSFRWPLLSSRRVTSLLNTKTRNSWGRERLFPWCEICLQNLITIHWSLRTEQLVWAFCIMTFA